MHPALSIICFTTLSGLGYGLAMVVGLGGLGSSTLAGRVAYGVASVLIVGGLSCSTLHLGHPERAWRALSQWRTSWLSREGVLAIVTFAPLGLAATGAILLGQDWRIAAVLSAVLSLLTVYATSMIYASLKTVRQWHSVLTPAVFLLFAIGGGLLLASALDFLYGFGNSGTVLPAIAALAAVAVAKFFWWRRVDGDEGASTIESATGLGSLGAVRILEQPHTGTSYLRREMGFRVARKHAAKLRLGVWLFAFILPVLALVAAFADPIGIWGARLLPAAVASHLLGVFVERWLFFAEARHTVMLYYGEARA